MTGCPSGTRTRSSFRIHVHTDFRVREFLKTKLADASVSRILIDRAAKRVNITIQTARPGIVIGKKGEDIEKLRAETAKMLKLPSHRRAPEHRRDPQARARCAARGRRHRAADREARDVPPRHEARRDEHHAFRRPGREGAPVGPPQRLGNRAHGMGPRRPRAAAHLPCRHRLRPGRSPHHLRRHRRQGVDLQGRSVRQGRARRSRPRTSKPPRLRRAPPRTPLPLPPPRRRRPPNKVTYDHATAQAHQISQAVQGNEHRPRPSRQLGVVR